MKGYGCIFDIDQPCKGCKKCEVIIQEYLDLFGTPEEEEEDWDLRYDDGEDEESEDEEDTDGCSIQY